MTALEKISKLFNEHKEEFGEMLGKCVVNKLSIRDYKNEEFLWYFEDILKDKDGKGIKLTEHLLYML